MEVLSALIFMARMLKFKSSETQRALRIKAQLHNRMAETLNIFSINGDDTSVYHYSKQCIGRIFYYLKKYSGQ